MSSPARPLGSTILLEWIDVTEDKTFEGTSILIPENIKEMSAEGELKTLKLKVVAVGPGDVNSSGVLLPMEVQVGDIVVINKFSGATLVKIEGKEYKFIKESEILAILEEKIDG